MPERAVAPSGDRTAELPAWSRWNALAAERPWTVGVEEEVMLLDAATWSVANRIDEVLAALPSPVASHFSAETHACVVELKTAEHSTVAGAAAELGRLRHALAETLHPLGLRAAVAGMHPLAQGSDVGLTSDRRHREIATTMRALAQREPTMALHVHVALADGATASRALDGLRDDLPLLLALSANSPFWRGRDSGFASMRTPTFSMFPRVGIPRHFGRYETFVRTVDLLLRSGAVSDPSFLWWDARLQPGLGTLEVRIMDAQSCVADVAALTALVQCLARRHAEGRATSATDPELLDENRFLAARDGMRAQLVDGRTGRRLRVSDALAAVLEECRPFAATLGCTSELADATALGADPGDARQRRLVARHGLAALPARLNAEFAPAGPALVAA